MELERKIRGETDRTAGFGRDIAALPGCESLTACIQCGACSGACPLSIYMDQTPRQVIGLVRADFKKQALASNTIWLCSSCYACTVQCPRQIGITDIMYALKQCALRERVYPRRFPIPILARQFVRMVARKGRITETPLVISLFLRANWKAALSSWRLGLNLIRTGRFIIRQQQIKRPHDLAAMLAQTKHSNSGGPP